MGRAAKLRASRRLVRWPALLGLTAILVALALAPAAASHAPGCRFPNPQPPVGSAERVYPIPHGCVRLVVPRVDGTALPTVVVRQHDRRGELATRRFRLPDTNLDRANGSIGICAHDSTFLFTVSYPFLTVVAHELYDLGDGRRECLLDFDAALLWTGHLSRAPLRMTWYTHEPRR